MQKVYDGDEHTEGRRALVARLLSERPWCEACETLDRPEEITPQPGERLVMRSQDVHEILPRSAGGDILNAEGCLVLCRGCHMYIHAHPERARALGLLRSRYAKKDPVTEG